MADAMPQDQQSELVAHLFEQYHGAVYAYVCRLVGDGEWAAELTQDAFLRVFKARDRLAAVENQRAWIYRIATNTAFNALRRRRRFAWLPWHLVDNLFHMKDATEQIGQRDAVESALLALPPKYRAPLLLYAHYGFSVAEVAEALDISEGAVKTRTYRAREMFRRAYGQENVT
jgi:RNA polymerase sigma-70 factor, ECF subfamily